VWESGGSCANQTAEGERELKPEKGERERGRDGGEGKEGKRECLTPLSDASRAKWQPFLDASREGHLRYLRLLSYLLFLPCVLSAAGRKSLST